MSAGVWQLSLLFLLPLWRRAWQKSRFDRGPMTTLGSGVVPNSVLFLIVTCNIGKKKVEPFDASRLPGPSRELPCSLETNPVDCREAVPMLNFMIATYDHPLADKYVFLHGHENSWHYRPNIFEQTHKLLNTSYFWNEDFGGVYRRFYTVGPQSFEPWAWPIYSYVFDNTTMAPDTANRRPAKNHHPCCATFFTKSSLIQRRPKSDYIRIVERLREWSRRHKHWGRRGPAVFCGTVLEWSWHLLLTNKTRIPVPPV